MCVTSGSRGAPPPVTAADLCFLCLKRYKIASLFSLASLAIHLKINSDVPNMLEINNLILKTVNTQHFQSPAPSHPLVRSNQPLCVLL